VLYSTWEDGTAAQDTSAECSHDRLTGGIQQWPMGRRAGQGLLPAPRRQWRGPRDAWHHPVS